jgi:hypothetical protein
VIARGVAADVSASAANSPTASTTVNMISSNYLTASFAGIGTTTVPTPGTAGNQAAAVSFANAAAGDFHEVAGSPTIDAGTTDSLVGALDLDGEARAQGCPSAPTPDIGADEFAGIGPSGCPAGPATSPGGASPVVPKKKCKKPKKRSAVAAKKCKKSKKH